MESDPQRGPLAEFAILFGTPLTHAEFDQRMAAMPLSDYVLNLQGKGGDPWYSYRKVAEAGSLLAELANRHGAQVYAGAILENLRAATANCETVIVLAHWTGTTFLARDIGSPDRLVAFIEDSTNPVLHEFRGLVPDPVKIADKFNAAIQDESLLKHLPPNFQGLSMITDSLRSAVLRDLIDEALGENIAPGNRLELFDGLHAIDVVEDAIDARFEGWLDLSLCNSIAPAVFIDRRRRGRVKTFHWPVEIAPGPQCLMILDTLDEIARQGGSYMDCRMRRFEILRRERTPHDV